LSAHRYCSVKMLDWPEELLKEQRTRKRISCLSA
jgi:hypothetical protein